MRPTTLFFTTTTTMGKDEIVLRLGKAIRTVRLARGESLASMAYKMNYKSESAYSKIELGKVKDLSILRFVDICQALNVCPHYVYRLANVEPPPDNNEFETYEDFLKFINSSSSS